MHNLTPQPAIGKKELGVVTPTQWVIWYSIQLTTAYQLPIVRQLKKVNNFQVEHTHSQLS